MTGMLFAIALFGCSDDGSQCQRIETAPAPTYRAMAECSAHIADAVQSEAAMRADFPTVQAQCMTTKQLAALGSRPVDLPRPALQLASSRR